MAIKLRFCLGFPRQLNPGSLKETTGVQRVSLVVSVYLTLIFRPSCEFAEAI